MTNDEATRVVKIMSSADGGCVHCWAGLLRAFVFAFPQFEELVDNIWASDGYRSGDWKEI